MNKKLDFLWRLTYESDIQSAAETANGSNIKDIRFFAR